MATPEAAQAQQRPGPQYSLDQAAAKIQAFREAMPELDNTVIGLLLAINPAVVAAPTEEARGKLEGISQQLGVSLPTAARLVAKVAAAWNSPAEVLRLKLQPLAVELDAPMSDVVDLLAAQPVLWAINTPSIIKDRLEPLAESMSVTLLALIHLIARQPMVWQIKPDQVKSSVPAISAQLGLSSAEALQLVAKMPVLLALETRLLVLGMNGLASTMGVPLSQLQDVVSKSLGLVAVPAEVLGSNLETLAAVLDVDVLSVSELVIRQPTLLALQAANIATAMDAVSSGLGVSRAAALDVLTRQPGLGWDITAPAIAARLDALSRTFEVPVEDIKQLAQQQPALLVITANTLRAALNAFEEQMGQPPAACLNFLVNDPGAFVMFGYLGRVIEQWCERLGLDEEQVSDLVTRQPALLEMSPTTVKARLESLSALFEIPLGIACQLVIKHPALATIPPNATITKAKTMSLALGCSMQAAATLMAKEPGVLCCCAAPPGELNRDLKPHLEDIQEVVSSYEYYTMDWLARGAKEASPQTVTSFSQMDTRPRPGR